MIASCDGNAVFDRLHLAIAVILVAAAGCPPSEPGKPDEPVGKLVVNEVNCSKNPDEFVELKNIGDGVIDTAGFGVAGDSNDDAFPVPPRKLDPGERVMITGDLGLSCANEGAVLVLNGVVVDEAPLRTGDADRSTWGRIPDGTGAFTETVPTPQKANVAFVDERGSVFNSDFATVATVDLFVAADVEERLQSQGKGAGYVPATFMYSDETGSSPPQRVDVRIKGSITLREWVGKPGLKIHFARHGERGPVEFRGLRKMTLNNLTYDPSFIREFLAYELMNRAGQPAPRVSWVQVFVNGEDKGLYSTIETYDRVFLDDHYDGTEIMYESDGSTPIGELGGFDVDEGPEDFQPLQELADHIATAPAGNVIDTFPEVDWRQIARVSALEDLLGHFDGHKGANHNFFLHQDKSGQWTLLPWSVDLVLVGSISSGPLGSAGRLVQLCDSDEGCLALFERARDQAARLVLQPEGTTLRELVVPIATRLQPFAHADEQPFSGNEFWQGVSTDLEQNANDAVSLLEVRAGHVRCATSVARGEGVPDGEPADCGGFVANTLSDTAERGR